MKISSSPAPGTLVTRKHKRPQCRRHGVVVKAYLSGSVAVKFHGMKNPVILPLSKLDFYHEK